MLAERALRRLGALLMGSALLISPAARAEPRIQESGSADSSSALDSSEPRAPGFMAQRFAADVPWPYALGLEVLPTLGFAGAGWYLEYRSAPDADFVGPWRPDRDAYHTFHAPSEAASDWTGVVAMGMLTGAELVVTPMLLGAQHWRVAAMDVLVATEAAALGFFVAQSLKVIIRRCRPAAFDPKTGSCRADGHFAGSDALRSFPSGHTLPISALAGAYLGGALRSAHPNQAWVRWSIFVLAEVLSGLTAALRVRAGAHSRSDVAVSFVLGNALGFGVSLAHPMLPASRARSPDVAASAWSLGYYDGQFVASRAF